METVYMSGLTFDVRTNRVVIQRNTRIGCRTYRNVGPLSIGRVARAMKTLSAKRTRKGNYVVYLFDPMEAMK